MRGTGESPFRLWACAGWLQGGLGKQVQFWTECCPEAGHVIILSKEAKVESRAAVTTGKRDALTQEGGVEDEAMSSVRAQTGLVYVLL